MYLSAGIPIVIVHDALDELRRHGLFRLCRVPSDRSIVKEREPVSIERRKFYEWNCKNIIIFEKTW